MAEYPRHPNTLAPGFIYPPPPPINYNPEAVTNGGPLVIDLKVIPLKGTVAHSWLARGHIESMFSYTPD